MFEVHSRRPTKRFRILVGCLVFLSITNLGLALWLIADMGHERGLVDRIVRHVPAADRQAAQLLAQDLQFSYRLLLLAIVNIAGGAIATTILVKAYATSQVRLREARVAANDILLSLRHAVISVDRHGVITSLNPNAQSMLRLSQDVVGIPIIEVAPSHPPLEGVLRDLEPQSMETREIEYDVTLDGHPNTYLAGCNILRNEQHQELGRIFHLHDITEKVLIEKRLRRMERYYSLGALAAGLHHEIRNPLSALSLHIQLLREALLKNVDGDRIFQILEILGTEIHRMTSVLDSFRDYASASELKRCSFSLRRSLGGMVDVLRPQATQQHVSVELRCSDCDDFGIVADQTKIEQVCMNLLINALHAMCNGGILTVELETVLDSLIVRVRDTGPGIPQKLQHRVFEPYFSTKQDGTGLGLALSDKFVQLHGGTIEFESSSAGTTFTVRLRKEAS